MVHWHGQGAMHLMGTALSQHQPGQGGACSHRQPPAVIVRPPQCCQLCASLLNNQGAAFDPQRTATTFRYAVPVRVVALPRLPKVRLMPRSITGIAQPMQVHAKGVQITHCGGVLKMPAQQACRGKTETFTGSCQRVQMIGMSAPQADDTGGS
ncbi:hypothetical protein D3C72_1427290 [compost metagenome]